MSCGLPVIGSTVSGIKDLIEHGENGWLCGTSPKEIREAILTVMSDTKLQERMGRNARNLILEKFALNRTAPQEMELLKDFSRDAE
jgi:glycosyltransferase involved in cell wall biosynthesis